MIINDKEYDIKPCADLTGANLTGADLYGANLYGAYLTGADLTGANLRGANLYGADLTGANLRGADLYGANLYGAYLTGADLTGANLTRANLSEAILREANLYGANLYGANLYGAYLYGAYLYGAKLYGANLTCTCLDPSNNVPAISDETLTENGLTIDGDYVVGWRTKVSTHCGSTVYETGSHHKAPWFSISSTDCHPGIYLSGKTWLTKHYGITDFVQVKCLRTELHKAGGKFRAKQVWVL